MLDFVRNMKIAIAEKVEALSGNVSFVELSEIPGFKGEYDYMIPQLNVIFWQGLSLLALEAIKQLIAEDVIEMKPAHVLTYAIDGITLGLPIAEDLVAHSELSWMPLKLNLGERFYYFLEP